MCIFISIILIFNIFALSLVKNNIIRANAASVVESNKIVELLIQNDFSEEDKNDSVYDIFFDTTHTSSLGANLDSTIYEKLVERINEDIMLAETNNYDLYSERMRNINPKIVDYYNQLESINNVEDLGLETIFNKDYIECLKINFETFESERNDGNDRWDRDYQVSYNNLLSAVICSNTNIELINDYFECAYPILVGDSFLYNKISFSLELSGDSFSTLDIDAYYISDDWYIYYQGIKNESKTKKVNSKAKTGYHAACEAIADLEIEGKIDEDISQAIDNQWHKIEKCDFDIQQISNNADLQVYVSGFVSNELASNNSDENGFFKLANNGDDFIVLYHNSNDDPLVGCYPYSPSNEYEAFQYFEQYCDASKDIDYVERTSTVKFDANNAAKAAAEDSKEKQSKGSKTDILTIIIIAIVLIAGFIFLLSKSASRKEKDKKNI